MAGMPGRKKPETSIAELIALYEAGYTLREIGQRIGRAHQGIAQRLQRAGITLRPRGQSKYARRATN